jgi:CRISPR-associated endonuclease/helicase Cas3
MALLAKCGAGAPTLLQHTRDVVDAAEALFGTSHNRTRLGGCWLRFFRLPVESWPVFHATLLAACGLHDWGKANDGFQAAIHGCGHQAIRHEHLSALLAAQAPVWSWLASNPLIDREVVLSAVLTHHLKASGAESTTHGFASALNGAQRFELCNSHDELTHLGDAIAARLGLRSPEVFRIPTAWTFDPIGGNVVPERKRIKIELRKFERAFSADKSRQRLMTAVRAALIAADAAGSGLRRTGQPITEWITKATAESGVWNAAAVRRNVIEPRIAQVERLRGVAFRWNDFQDHCADPSRVPSRSLLLAPCGSGKTLAAWRWIEQQAGPGVGHIVFLYPTRATAAEGFRDYVGWAPEADAALMHGTSGFDLEKMFENPPEGETREGAKYKLSEAEERLFAVGFWGRRAFSATVDQFLAFLQYAYRPMCMLPVLADSVVVIDEVHSFDNKMFSALKSFLREFDVPVLCMTATLPEKRRHELVAGCGLKAYPDGAMPPDLKEVAERPRYRVRRVDTQATATQAVIAALAADKRVLWVVNQVRRAHAVVAMFVGTLPADPSAGSLRTTEGIPVACYHSRYRLNDRLGRHADTMALLKERPGPSLGVTTQVCEMSLDIDVDLLVTEDCPVTSLVQRMGRCNRAQHPRPLGRAGDVLVYKPSDDAPYLRKAGSDPLAGLEQFLRLVDGRDLSQDDLDRFMREVDSPASPGDALSMFVESGAYAVAGEQDFREGDEFTRKCVLLEDIDDFVRAVRDRQPGFGLPVPGRLADARRDDESSHRRLPQHLAVARAGHYHTAVGYCDRPLTAWGGV